MMTCLLLLLWGCGPKGPSPDEATRLTAEADRLTSQNRIAPALDALLKAEKADPGNAELHLKRARLLDSSAHYGEAVDEAETARKLDPKSLEAVMAELQFGSGFLSPAKAEELARQAVALAPDSPDGHLNLGRAIAASGDAKRLPDAIKSLQEANRIAPTAPAPLLEMGKVYLRMGDTVRATAMLQSAIQLLDMQAASGPMGLNALTDWVEARRSAAFNLSQSLAAAHDAGGSRKAGADAAIWAQRSAELRKIRNRASAQPPDVEARSKLSAILRQGVGYWSGSAGSPR